MNYVLSLLEGIIVIYHMETIRYTAAGCPGCLEHVGTTTAEDGRASLTINTYRYEALISYEPTKPYRTRPSASARSMYRTKKRFLAGHLSVYLPRTHYVHTGPGTQAGPSSAEFRGSVIFIDRSSQARAKEPFEYKLLQLSQVYV